jgi:hypothetical protein
MKNKKIVLGVILLLFEFPKITFAFFTDGSYSPGLLSIIISWFVTVFIFLGLPLLGVALFFTLIYLIVEKVRDNKKIFNNSLERGDDPKSSNKVVITILSLALCILSGIFIYVGIKIHSRANFFTERDSALKNKYGAWAYNCVEHSRSDYIGSFFQEYAVKKGDSLFSIAKEKLHDQMKVTDIINLNKEKYSSISYDSQFQDLEPGWKLLLPPTGLNVTGDSFPVSIGKLLEKKETGTGGYDWVVGNKKKTYDHYYTYESTIIDDSIKIGDCIDIIGGIGGETFEIHKQD